MSGQVSALARMFTEVWRRPPSKETTTALVAMELRSGLRADDMYAPIAIVQFRQLEVMQEVCASIGEIADQHQIAQARFAQNFRDALAEMHQMTQSQPRQKRKFWRRERERRTPGGYETGPVVLDVYQKDAPVLSYLGQAFAIKNGVLERDERIAAARRSMLYLVPCLAAVAMLGALVGHYFLNG